MIDDDHKIHLLAGEKKCHLLDYRSKICSTYILKVRKKNDSVAQQANSTSNQKTLFV